MDYTGKKTFTVEHASGGEITVEIDFDYQFKPFGPEVKPVKEAIEEMVEFWANWKTDLKENGYDYIKTFLKRLCCKVLCLQVEYCTNQEGIIRLINREEGYYPIDGSIGIKLISVSGIDFSEFDDYTIETVEPCQQ
jgi:hypothetical protein